MGRGRQDGADGAASEEEMIGSRRVKRMTGSIGGGELDDF